MNKLRSIVFSVICIMILGCVLVFKGIEHSPLSSLVSSALKETSQLEGRNYEHLPELELESIVEATFQSDFEQYVADSIPWRDQALMLNAGVQRTQISLASKAFGYACYPTFYGSEYVYVLTRDAVVETLKTLTPSNEQAMERAAAAISELAEANEDVSFYLLTIDRANASDANPTLGYVTNPLTYTVLDEQLYDRLSPAITVTRQAYHTEDEMLDALYRTDHHWHTSMAYDCYAEQVVRMIPNALPAEVLERISYDDIDFIGSCSRGGLCAPVEPDHIDDCVIDMSGFTVVRDRKEYGADVLEKQAAYLDGNINPDPFTNRYAEYFHGDWGLWRIDNPNAQTDQSLLIVRDSFGGCMERFFAANYAHVYVVDFRHTDVTAAQLLAEHEDIDDVLVIMGYNNLISEAGIAGLTL